VQEWLAEPGLVVSKLGLRDSKVLPDALAIRAVSARQSLQGVQDGTRSLVFPRQHCLPRRTAFEIHLGREMRVKHDAET